MFLNKRKLNTMDGICRTCMSSDKPVRSLFEVDTDYIELHVKLYTCFPTFNLDDSDFPTAMCDVCIKMLRNAYKFRELCVKSTCTFLQKRNNNKTKNCETETVSTNTETNTDNEQNLVLSTSDVGTSTDNFDNILETTKRVNEISVDSSSSDLTESTETSINTLSSINININDKLDNVEISNIDSNANKKCIKVYPLNSPQITCNNEVQTSPQPPVLVKQSQSTEDLNESVDKITDNLYILNDYILLNRKTLDNNEINEKENAEHEIKTNEEINLPLTIDPQNSQESNNFVCSIPIEHLNEDIQKELNEKIQNQNLPEDDGFSSESDETSLLKPLENYTQNNFIKSALAYLDGDSVEEEVEFQDEIEVTAQSSEENITDSQETENESSINLFETFPIQELQISDVVSLNEESQKVEEEPPEIKPIITPIPISKLIGRPRTQRKKKSADSVDDLVSKNVTEVTDYTNHNDHNYAKIHYENVDATSQLQTLDSRKRRFSGRIVSLQAAKSTPSMVENVEIKPETSPEQPVIKKLRRRTITSDTNIEKGEVIEMPKLIPMQNLVKSNPNKSIIPVLKPQLETVKRGASVYDFIDELCENPILKTMPKLREKPSLYKTPEETSINVTKIVRKRVFRKRNTKLIDGPVKRKYTKILPKEEPNVKENIPKTKDEPIPKVQEEEPIIKDNNLKNIQEESVSNTLNTESTNVEQFKVKKNIVNIKIKKKKLKIPAVKKNIKEFKITRQRKKLINEKIKKESPEIKTENDKSEEEPPIKLTITRIKNPEETKIATTAADVTAMNEDEVSNEMDLEYPFECDLCGMRKKSLSDLREHLFLHTENRIMCRYCGRTFKSSAGCNRHVGMIHKKENEADLAAAKLEASSPTKLETTTPTKLETSPTKPEISIVKSEKSEISTTESDISASPDSKYSHLCTVCDKVLPTRNSLLQHKKIHNSNQ